MRQAYALAELGPQHELGRKQPIAEGTATEPATRAVKRCLSTQAILLVGMRPNS